MAQAIKTMGAILNDASEGMARDMEGARRSALTGVQLKGEVADQQWKEQERGRAKQYWGELEKIYQEEMFTEQPVESPQALPDASPGATFAPQQTKRVPINPGSPKGMEAIGRIYQRELAVRQRLGMAKPEEITQLIDFRKKLEQSGAAEEFRSAMNGDKAAVAKVAERFGLNGLQAVTSGTDENGALNIYALIETTGPGGAKESRRVPIGHLMGAFSPEIDAMIKGSRDGVKFKDDLKNNAADRQYKSDSGYALRTNANTNSSRSAANAARYQQSVLFADRQKDTKYVIPGFMSRQPGEDPKAIEDTSGRGYVNRIGDILIGQDMFGGDAFLQAQSMLSQANAEAAREFDQYKRTIENAYRIVSSGKPVKMPNGAVISPDDEEAVKNLTAKWRVISKPADAATVWQQGRDQLLEEKIAELTAGARSQAISQ